MGGILSALGSALAGGISGAGQGVVEGVTSDMKEEARAREIKEMQEAEQAKMIAIAHDKYNQDNAHLVRAGQYVRDAIQNASSGTPVAPPQASGAGPRDPGTVDLSGDWSSINASYKAGQGARNSTQSDILNQELAKATAPADVASLGREISRVGPVDPNAPQMNLKTTDASQQGNAPAMREKTRAEIFQDAVKKAEDAGDLQAAAAIKASIPDNLMSLADGATLYDKTTGKVVMQNNGKEERQNQREDRKDARQEFAEDARAERFANQNKDSQFIKELKAMYPEGSPEYKEALQQRINKETNSAGGSSHSLIYNNRIIASGNQVAEALKNITALPVTANAGFMGQGKPESTSILSAGVAGLKNELNSDQIKDYNTMWTGISRSLGTLETSGLATTGSLIASIDKLAFVPGDNGYNALRKLAEVRQIVSSALEPKLADPSIPKQQHDYIQNVIEKVNQAVPYTHADVTKFKNSQANDPALTFADFAKKSLGVSPATLTSSHNAPGVIDFGSLK